MHKIISIDFTQVSEGVLNQSFTVYTLFLTFLKNCIFHLKVNNSNSYFKFKTHGSDLSLHDPLAFIEAWYNLTVWYFSNNFHM